MGVLYGSHKTESGYEVFVWPAVVIVIVLILGIGWVPNYSEGERAGVVTKISNKGIFFKSWEGSLNQGGMIEKKDSEGRAQMVPNIMHFSVTDEKVVNKLKHAMETGESVNIHYKEWLFKPLTIDSSHVVF